MSTHLPILEIAKGKKETLKDWHEGRVSGVMQGANFYKSSVFGHFAQVLGLQGTAKVAMCYSSNSHQL